jgi:hypothetical protein
LVRLSYILPHSKTQKHDNSPSSGPIWTIPTRQSRLLLIRGRGNVRGGWWHHHRRRTGVGKCRRWPGCDGCQEGSSGRMDGIGTSDDASRCWEEDAKGLG